MPVDKVVRFKSNEAYESVLKICKENDLSIIEEDDLGVLIISKKDEWEGVEFARFKFPNPNQFPFFKIKQNGVVLLRKENGVDAHKNNCEPITESVYIEHLKKEAIRRGIISICSLDISMMHGGQLEDRSTEFKYRKDTDTLYWFGCPIYQQGKWATKLPKRIQVIFNAPKSELVMDHYGLGIIYRFNICDGKIDQQKAIEAGRFLNKQLEAYLNGEIGKGDSNG